MGDNKVYLIQANYTYSGGAHLPYAVGALQAFAISDRRVSEIYSFQAPVFKREDPERALEKIESPSVVGFSSYVWNYEYNKALAGLVKERYPDCKIIFGGHHIKNDISQLIKYGYIDVLIHGEGEEAFRDVLLSFAGEKDISQVKNISFRKDGQVFKTETQQITRSDYPSPYLTGVFDPIIAENPGLNFLATFETNRGCPYSCAYCDWGSLCSKVRLFPMERVKKEIEWMAEHKIEICGTADANFGILKRDEEITELLVEAKKKTGYPKRFQTSFAKNSNERVFKIGRMLEENGMSRGVTISFQTMSDIASENVLRKNITVDSFAELMSSYNSHEIPTYTELILGLPGETLESLKDGINRLLAAGQHYTLYIHNCEVLPCAALAQPDFIEKYKIGQTKIPLNEPHHDTKSLEGIREYSRIVTSTCSMSEDDWIEMNVFACFVQAFHHLGLMRYIAIYLYYTQAVRYDDFYSDCIEHFSCDTGSVVGKALQMIRRKLKGVLERGESLTAADERFGDIDWPFEELLFLDAVYDRELFYAQVSEFLKKYIDDGGFAQELIRYQMQMLVTNKENEKELSFRYDFYSYFKAALAGRPEKLQKREIKLFADEIIAPQNWQDYARTVVWYGRKAGRSFLKYRKGD